MIQTPETYKPKSANEFFKKTPIVDSASTNHPQNKLPPIVDFSQSFRVAKEFSFQSIQDRALQSATIYGGCRPGDGCGSFKPFFQNQSQFQNLFSPETSIFKTDTCGKRHCLKHEDEEEDDCKKCD